MNKPISEMDDAELDRCTMILGNGPTAKALVEEIKLLRHALHSTVLGVVTNKTRMLRLEP